MTFEGGTEDIISHILAEACDRPRDEHPSVVLHDVVGRPRRQAHVIVFANDKGGVGKSTLAFHCAVAWPISKHRCWFSTATGGNRRFTGCSKRATRRRGH